VREGGVLEILPLTDKLSCAVWFNELELPVNVTVVLLLVEAPGAAERVTCWDVPTPRLKLDGDAETPAGRPEVWTLICDEKPSTAAAETETDVEFPAAISALAGLTVKVKSGPLTAKLNWIVCVSELAVPVKVTVAVAVAAP